VIPSSSCPAVVWRGEAFRPRRWVSVCKQGVSPKGRGCRYFQRPDVGISGFVSGASQITEIACDGQGPLVGLQLFGPERAFVDPGRDFHRGSLAALFWVPVSCGVISLFPGFLAAQMADSPC